MIFISLSVGLWLNFTHYSDYTTELTEVLCANKRYFFTITCLEYFLGMDMSVQAMARLGVCIRVNSKLDVWVVRQNNNSRHCV